MIGCTRRGLMGTGAVAALAGVFVGSGGRAAGACSRVLWNDTGRGVYVGRNMDWFEDLKSNMWVLPRGMDRDGAVPENPLRWTSRHGSILLTAYDSAVVDGVNEAGLGVHLHYLPEASTAPRDPAKPGLSIAAWGLWHLDMHGSVAEAVEALRAEPFQIRMAVEPISGMPGTIHLALNDRSGDSAVLECIGGKINVYHDRRYVVMTNQPTFDKQLENLSRYRGFGGDERLPGTHEAADRFVRAAYYATHLPKPSSKREAVAGIMSVMRNVSAPFGMSDPERPNIATTIWRTVWSLEQEVVYYDITVSPNVFWVRYGEIDYAPASGVRKLTIVDNFDLIGDVTDQFVPAAMFHILAANE